VRQTVVDALGNASRRKKTQARLLLRPQGLCPKSSFDWRVRVSFSQRLFGKYLAALDPVRYQHRSSKVPLQRVQKTQWLPIV